MEQQQTPSIESLDASVADQLRPAAAGAEHTAAPAERGPSVAAQGAAAGPAALASCSTGAAQPTGSLSKPGAVRQGSPQPPPAGAARRRCSPSSSSGGDNQQQQAPRGPTPDTTKAGADEPLNAGQPRGMQGQMQGVEFPAAQHTESAAAAAGQRSHSPQLDSNSGGGCPGMEDDAPQRAPHGLMQQSDPGGRSSGGAGMPWLGGNDGGSSSRASGGDDQAGRAQRPPSPVLPGSQQQGQESQGSGRGILASPDAQQVLQQQQQDARLMPPPPARGSSPHDAPAEAQAADDDQPATQRPPRLEIPTSGSTGSQQQAHTQVLQQQQQHVAQPGSARLERPGSAPTPRSAPQSSTTVTPSLLNMGLSDGAAWSAGSARASSGSQQWRQRRVLQGELTRRVNAEHGGGGGIGNEGQQQQQQPGVVFSPLSRYPLASPGQRRRRSEQGGGCDVEQLRQRPASADVPSGCGRAAAAAGDVDDDEQEQELAAKRPKSSLASVSSHSKQRAQQQQPLLPAGFVPAGPGGVGLSISPAGPLSGLAWQQPVCAAAQQTPPAAIREAGASGGAIIRCSPGGAMVPVQQQQRQQGQVGSSSQHALQQERPVVLSLTPPNQLTAALQRPDSSGRQQRRTHASSSAASAASSADAPHKQQQQAADASAALPQQSQQLQQEALFSPAGRPLRQQSSRRNAATAAAERYQRLDRDTGPVSYAGGLRFLQVWCDQLPGNLDLQRMLVIPQAGEREGHPMSLSQFEILGGRGSARKWRRSVSVDDAGLVISLGEWLEKYAEGPGGDSGVAAAGYKRASGKPRAALCTPPAAGEVGRSASWHDQSTARADAAAAAAAPLQAQVPALLGTLPLQHQQQPSKPRRRGAPGGLAPVPSPSAATPSSQPSRQDTGRGSPILAGLTAPHLGAPAQLRAQQHPAVRAAAALAAVHGHAGAAELSLSAHGSTAAGAASVSDIWSFCLLPDMAPDGAAHMELQLHAGHVDDLADADAHHQHQHLLMLGSPAGANLLASPLTLQLEAAAASATPPAPSGADRQE